jgi:enamine deaminase RidA (YjgF/YER057c/UK114 family)
MDVYKRLEELSIVLPESPTPKGLYTPVVEFGDKFLYTSGAGSIKNGELIYTGKVGQDISLEQGQSAARQCMLNLLSNLNKYLGDLNKVKRIIKILAFVASDDNFHKQALVVNGASEILIQIFGEERGKAARTAVGVNVLPGNQPVEIEMIVELK